MPRSGAVPPTFRRYHLHIIVYFLVALFLMILGCIFSAFAIFVKDSELGKVWLAGPTTIAVGLVLCGKVIIDCRPPPNQDDSDCEDEESFIGEDMAYLYTPVDEQQSTPGPNDGISSMDIVYQDTKTNNHKPMVIDNSRSCQNNSLSAIWNPRSDGNSLVDGVADVANSGNTTANDIIRCTEHTRCMCKEMQLQPEDNRPRSASAVMRHQSPSSESDPRCNTHRRAASVRPHHQSRYCPKTNHNRKPADLSPGYPGRTSSTSLEHANRTALYQGEMFVFHDRQYMI